MPDIDSLASPAMRLTILAVAFGFMALEYLTSRLTRHHRDTHDLAETAASFGVALVQKLVRGLEAGLLALPFAFVSEHRLLDFDPGTPAAIGALFLATEFVYYGHHRASHRIRWLWATHAVHHSATTLNLTAAIRLGWTGGISGSFLFFLPLAWIGFHPVAIVAMLGVNLLYQFFIHTEFAPRLGALEWVLNTPTHHRVHHASNAACLDRNYGGTLIVFDRLFGSFARAPKNEPLRYGLVGSTPTLNPLRIELGEWAAMARDVRRASSLSGQLRALFAPPGSTSLPKARPSAPILAVGGLVALLGCAAASAAQAQQMTPSQREAARACMPDVRRLCAGVQRGGGRILACLREQAPALSPPCRTAIEGRAPGGADGRQATPGHSMSTPPGSQVMRDLAYGPDPAQRMHVYLPASPTNAPILVMVHGGARSRATRQPRTWSPTRWRTGYHKASSSSP